MTSANASGKCRVCTCALEATAGRYDMLRLAELAHKFVTCTNLSVAEEQLPNLPSELCQACSDKLEELYAFRDRCIAADAQWRLELATCENEKANYNLERTQDQQDSLEVEFPELHECEIKATGRRRTRQKSKEAKREQVEAAISPKEEQSLLSKISAANFLCDICNTRFQVEHRLLAHKRQHEGLMPYPCPEIGCERAFNRMHCLSEHLKQHTGTSRWFSCEQEGCNKSYRHKPTLMMHIRRCHKLGPELKSHVCEFCGKVFNSKAVLNDHRYTHKDKSELPHACPESECSRRFSSKEKLKVHLLRHAGIKNFSCPYCGMRKTTRNELKIHINYHTLERTWPCRFCSKVCNSSGNLKMHVRTVHERARDYDCSYCEKSFAKPDTRKYHEMTHTGEKPNECEECGKRFTQPAALRTHRKIHERQRKEMDDNLRVYTVVIAPSTETGSPGDVP
ncbi:hypothetical protein ACLKA6_016712 [Drosophila palustris]